MSASPPKAVEREASLSPRISHPIQHPTSHNRVRNADTGWNGRRAKCLIDRSKPYSMVHGITTGNGLGNRWRTISGTRQCGLIHVTFAGQNHASSVIKFEVEIFVGLRNSGSESNVGSKAYPILRRPLPPPIPSSFSSCPNTGPNRRLLSRVVALFGGALGASNRSPSVR
jgi:hypothetical protein